MRSLTLVPALPALAVPVLLLGPLLLLPLASATAAPPMLPGWPQFMGVAGLFAPVGVTLADLDGDGDLEVIAGSTDNFMRAWNHDGTLLAGWPVNLGGQIQSKAAAADLDGDGDLEILVAVKTGMLHVLQANGAPLAGWPKPWGGAFGFIAPSVRDLDGDGRPEVLIGGGGSVYAYRADGTLLWTRVVGGNITGTLATGDVNGDGRPEIFAVAVGPNTLHGLAADGTVLPGWPRNFGLSNSWAAPAIGDLDGDGRREVLVVGYSFGNFSQIFAFRGDGTSPPGFPVTYPSVQTYSCPVIGDVDGDGDLELFNAGKVNAAPSYYAWNHLGAVLPGWPEPLDNMEGSTILADFDGEPQMEAVIADNYNPGHLYGYNVDGSTASDFPVPTPAACLPNSPAVGDVDGDGDLDLAMTSANGAVAVWDFAVAWNPAAVEWGTLFHDNWHTNQHGFQVPGGSAAVADPARSRPLRLALGLPAPNPAAPRTVIPFILPEAAEVRLTVVDVAGREVRALAAGGFAGGAHSIAWDGRNARGEAVARGVYWLRLEAPAAGAPLVQKIVVGR